MLGYDMSSGPTVSIGTAGGNGVGHAFVTRVSILGILPDGQASKGKVLRVIGNIQVVYAKDCNEFLLGQDSFLNKFILVINYPEKKFSLRLPELYTTGAPKAKRSRHGVH